MIDTRKRAWLIEGLELCQRLQEISGDLDWPPATFDKEADLETIRQQCWAELAQLERALAAEEAASNEICTILSGA